MINLKNRNFKEIADEIISWIIERKDTAISISIIAAVITGLLIYFFIHYAQVRKQTWDKLAIAEGYVFNNLNDQALQVLNDILAKSGNTDIKSNQYAKLLKSDTLYKMKDYKQSADLYSQIIRTNKPKIILPFAYAGLGYSKENLGDYSGSISAYRDFLEKFPDHYYTARIYESLARVYFLSGAIPEAKQTYEKIITLYPGTSWQQNASRRIMSLPQQNVQQPAGAQNNIPATGNTGK